MSRFFTFLIAIICAISFSQNALAAFCKKDLLISIKMDDDWYKKEELRLAYEDELLKQHSKYITKTNKPLIAEHYFCPRGEECDKVKNCQMERNVKNISEVEYAMKIDSGITILKSYCSVIGKCIGYNYFYHTSKVTAAEDRLIDIKKDNAIFYHYFYSAKSKSYEPLFNITNFVTGSELYLNDMPHFSADDKVILEVRSVPKKEVEGESSDEFPAGFNINIYEMNDQGEYVSVEPAEIDLQNPNKPLSTFLSRNPSCGETPHFHSWKNSREARLSMLPPSEANNGRKVILSFDKKLKKWGCQEDLFPEFKCESYLPNSTKFSSNLSMEQINNCKKLDEAVVVLE